MLSGLLEALLPGLTHAINAGYPSLEHGLNVLVEGLTAFLGPILGTL